MAEVAKSNFEDLAGGNPLNTFVDEQLLKDMSPLIGTQAAYIGALEQELA